MDFEFETKRTALANAFAAAGADWLGYMGMTDTVVAAIPDTQPQKYAVAGTLKGILSMAGKMMGEDGAEQTTGDMTDEQIKKVANEAVKSGTLSWTGFEEDEHGFYTVPSLSPYHYQFARAIARAAIATHLARQPKAEQPATAVPRHDVIAAAEPQFPPGYCTDPNGVIVPPFGAHRDYNFGYEIGFREAWQIMNDAVRARDKACSQGVAPTAHLARQAQAETPPIGKLLDEFSALPVLWGLNEPGALLRHSDVFKMLVNAGKTYLAPVAPAGAQNAVGQILKGIGKINGDGWKDVTKKGEVVFVWNTELPRPYKAGQFPRIGNNCGWSASTDQYNFQPATADEARQAVEAIIDSHREKSSAGAQNAEAIRNAVLEEAALAAEKVRDDYSEKQGGKWPELRDDAATGAGDCVTAIRALQTGSANTKEGGASAERSGDHG